MRVHRKAYATTWRATSAGTSTDCCSEPTANTTRPSNATATPSDAIQFESLFIQFYCLKHGNKIAVNQKGKSSNFARFVAASDSDPRLGWLQGHAVSAAAAEASTTRLMDRLRHVLSFAQGLRHCHKHTRGILQDSASIQYIFVFIEWQFKINLFKTKKIRTKL